MNTLTVLGLVLFVVLATFALITAVICIYLILDTYRINRRIKEILERDKRRY